MSVINDLLPVMASSLSAMQQSAALHCANIDYQGISAALASFAQASQHILDAATIADSFSSRAVLFDSLIGTMEQIEPYLQPEEKGQREAIIEPHLREKAHMHLKLSDTLSILSILPSILFFLLSSMPDDQTDRIIQQQSRIIANQEAEIAQLHKKGQALLDALDSLSDSINLLTNEIELLRDEIKDSNDLSAHDGQTNPSEPQ